jgi:hypothetical protein
MKDTSSFTLYDVFNYLSNRWKFYLVGALLGAVVALSMSLSNTSYTATAVLNVHRSSAVIPNFVESATQQDMPLDLISWRETQTRLVDFMREFAANKSPTNPALRDVAPLMSSLGWWNQNVLPVNFLPNKEAKEFLAINSMIIGSGRPPSPIEEKPELKLLVRAISETTRISQLQVRESAKTKEDALARVDLSANATINALVMLRYRALIQSLTESALSADTKLVSQAHELKLQLSSLENRRRQLQRLYQEFPALPAQSFAVTDESLSKYLPIPTQLIAVLIDINHVKDQQAAIELAQEKNALLKAFSGEAQKILSQHFEAGPTIEQLLLAESKLRATINKTDETRLRVLDSLRAQLLANQSINNRLVKETSAQIAQAPTPAKAAIKGAWIGLALALLLSVLISIIQSARVTARSSRD